MTPAIACLTVVVMTMNWTQGVKQNYKGCADFNVGGSFTHIYNIFINQIMVLFIMLLLYLELDMMPVGCLLVLMVEMHYFLNHKKNM